MTAATLPRMHGLEVVGAEGAAATGDTAADLAVVELELRHGQALFGFVRRQGLTDSEAEDAVQEALVRLWLEIRAGRAVANPRAWAYRAIYRIAMDNHRLHRRVSGLLQRLESRPTAPATGDAADQLAVWTEVDRLPLRQRQVLYLRYRADLSFEEIATTLGITASAARSHATQAMGTLRHNLAPDEVP